MEIFKEYKKMRDQIIKSGLPTPYEFEHEIQFKLLNLFMIGNFYYFIVDISTFKIDLLHKNSEAIMGYDSETYTLEFIINLIHPDDLNNFMNFENQTVNFFRNLPPEKVLKYKTRYDFRVKKADGSYIRLLHQSMAIQCSEDGGVHKTFVVHTDITELKKDNKSSLSFIGLEGEPSYINVSVDTVFKFTKDVFTPREKEVLLLLCNGKNSLQISEQLFISKFTVDKHRNNMLQKFNVNNTSELINKAIGEGWI